jgi:hypothetical protein
MAYRAFICYSHAQDAHLARALQDALSRQLRTGLFKRGGVFTAASDLPAGDEAASSIRNAVENSDYLVLLASPNAATSNWVRFELEVWLARHSPDHLLFVLTDGAIVWRRDGAGPDEQESTAFPPTLLGRLREEPLWADLRWARGIEDAPDRPQFQQVVTQLAAAILEVPFDQLFSKETGRRRARTRRLVVGAGVTFLALMSLSVVAFLQRSFAIKAAKSAQMQAQEGRMLRNLAERQQQLAEAYAREAQRQRALAELYSQELRKRLPKIPRGNNAEAERIVNELNRQTAENETLKNELSRMQALMTGYREQVAASQRLIDELRHSAPNAAVPQTRAALAPPGLWESFLRSHFTTGIYIVGALLVLVGLSTRGVAMLLQLQVWPFAPLAAAFYLTPLGRSRLYSAYRSRMRKLLFDQRIVERYVDLPYALAGAPASRVGLKQQAIEVVVAGNLVVLADGGRGKTTLCNCLVDAALSGTLTSNGRRYEPIVIDSASYTGNVVQSIVNVLNSHRAYVNIAIVEAQLLAGYMLIIIDGVSEIRDAQSSAPPSADIATTISRNQMCRFVLTSRSDLPELVIKVLGDPIPVITLRDVDEDSDRLFLGRYLSRRVDQLDLLVEQLRLLTAQIPRTPLMLRLAAELFDSSGEIPSQRVELFERYSNQLLRMQATGIEAKGLEYAVARLVERSYLASGGDRGITQTRAIKILTDDESMLKAFKVNLLPYDLIELLCKSGLYRQNRSYLRLFHDSFESFFAARVLELQFREREYSLLRQCASNERMIETWDFLLHMLDGDEQTQLRRLLSTTAGVAS